MNIKKTIQNMTLDEKAHFLSGRDIWRTLNIDRLNIPAVLMTDGPHGIRKENAEKSTDIFNTFSSYPATCFPTSGVLAATFNKNLLKRVGRVLGEECKAFGVSILLAPAINHKRTPIGGRNFEYFSEDPCLTGELAAQYVIGLQYNGTACTLKHFCANNTEINRLTINEEIDERTLREIYLAAFETVVKKAHPRAIMSAYNRFEGHYCSENKRLLTDILRNEWGFDGVVISDWCAIHDRAKAAEAGCTLEMPNSGEASPARIIECIQNGTLAEDVLNARVEELLKLVLSVKRDSKVSDINSKKGYALALEAAQEGIVLLKNENMLPLKNEDNVCIIGARAKSPRIQGSGSSRVNPFCSSKPYDELEKALGKKLDYCSGYLLNSTEINEAMILEAEELAAKTQKIVLFVGLDDTAEAESHDRENMKLNDNQNILLERILKINKNVTLVIMSGSPLELDWASDVKGIVLAGLCGEASGEAIANILIGKVSPSGRLAETWPKKLEDNPTAKSYAKNAELMIYDDGLLTGYRYYTTKNIQPLFNFGCGLSYTEFCYSDIAVTVKKGKLKVSFSVENIGLTDSSHAVLLFVSKECGTAFAPRRELKSFDKLFLKANEKKKVALTLTNRSFAYYDVASSSWQVDEGMYELALCLDANTPIKSVKYIYKK